MLQSTASHLACYKIRPCYVLQSTASFSPKLHNLVGLIAKFITCLRIMPPIRTGRTRTGDRNAQTNIQVSAAIFRHLTTAQLQELCRSNGLSAQGRRTALEKRLKNAGIAQTANSSEQIADRSSSTIPVQQRASPAALTEEQISKIKLLVQESVASASRDIAIEAARAAAEDMQSQVPPSLPSPPPQAVIPTNPGGVDILLPQEQQQQARQSLQLNDGQPSLVPCRYGAPFQDVPATYVKEIHSGEFFDLSKLLPKNLSLHDEEGPSSSSAISRGSYQGTCINYNKFGSCTRDMCKYKHTCKQSNGAHPRCDCSSKYRQQEGDREKDRDQGNSKASSSRRHK